MAFSIPIILQQVDALTQLSDGSVSEYSRQLAIKAAVERYSLDRPDQAVEDFTGDGGRFYLLTGASKVLSGWVHGFSHVIGIEYPAEAVSADHEPNMLVSEDWDDRYEDGTNQYLRLVSVVPAATETVRVRFTAPYSFSVSSTTASVAQPSHGFSADDYVFFDGRSWIKADEERVGTAQVTAAADADNFTYGYLEADLPPGHFYGISCLAASYVLREVATRASSRGASSLVADVTETSPADALAARAQEYLTQYEQAIGVNQPEQAVGRPMARFVAGPFRPDDSRRWLTHRRRR